MEMFLVLFFGITFIISLFISFKMDNDLHRTLPYARGYVIGYMCAIWPMAILAGLFMLCFAMGHPEAILTVPDIAAGFVALLFYSALGIGIIKRNRYIFLAYIILSFNILLWVFLGIYLWRRWDELKHYTVYEPVVEVIGKEEN